MSDRKTYVVLNAFGRRTMPKEHPDILTVGELIKKLDTVDSELPVFIGQEYKGYGWGSYGPLNCDDVFVIAYEEFDDYEDVTVLGMIE